MVQQTNERESYFHVKSFKKEDRLLFLEFEQSNWQTPNMQKQILLPKSQQFHSLLFVERLYLLFRIIDQIAATVKMCFEPTRENIFLSMDQIVQTSAVIGPDSDSIIRNQSQLRNQEKITWVFLSGSNSENVKNPKFQLTHITLMSHSSIMLLSALSSE